MSFRPRVVGVFLSSSVRNAVLVHVLAGTRFSVLCRSRRRGSSVYPGSFRSDQACVLALWYGHEWTLYLDNETCANACHSSVTCAWWLLVENGSASDEISKWQGRNKLLWRCLVECRNGRSCRCRVGSSALVVLWSKYPYPDQYVAEANFNHFR